MNKLTRTFITASFLSTPYETVFALDDLLMGDMPIVISASRLNQSVLTSPSSVTVIDKEMISASGFIEFADLLRLVPGFQVAHVDGRRFAVAYHGLGSDIGNRLQVLVNGRSTFTPSLSTVDWDLLGVQLEDIERIEVVRGSSASAYGSNSFTAAINIITKSLGIDNKTYIHYRHGNKGERHKIIRYRNSVKATNYRLTASQKKNDGLTDYLDSRDFDYFSFQTEFNRDSDHPMELYLSYSNGYTGTQISSKVLEPRNREANSWSAHLKGQKVISQTQDIKWDIYHNSDDIDDLAQSIPLSEILSEDLGISPSDFTALTGIPDQTFVTGDETNKSTKTDFEVTYHSITEAGLKYVIGTGVRYDTLRSKSYFIENGKVSDTTYRAFTNLQTPLTNNITLNGGAILESVKNYKSKISSRISLNYKINNTQTLRLSASHGYRMPSLLERNFDTSIYLNDGSLLDRIYVSDSDINQEKIISYDIGYLGQLSKLPISWDLKLYQDKLSDTIGFPVDESINDPVGNYYRLITNNGEHKAYGLEGELSYNMDQSFIKFHFNFSRTKTKFSEAATIPETEITSTAPNESYGILASKKIKDWRINLGAYHVGELEWLNIGDRIVKYSRVDLNLSKKFSIRNNIITLTLAAQNIGEKYKEFDNKRFFEPRYYATLSYTIP